MNTMVQNPIKLVTKVDQGRNVDKDMISYLLKAVENADSKMRNDIENQLVRLGEDIISELISLLEVSKGAARATISMILIRFGRRSIGPLRNAKLGWISDYIINEIEGSGISLTEVQEVLVS